MMSYLVVFVGAGVGGAIRHGMNIWVARLLGTHFPWHTFAINVTTVFLPYKVVSPKKLRP